MARSLNRLWKIMTSMRAESLEKWVGASGSGPESLLRHRFLEPPYGYAIGVLLWPIYVSVLSLWIVLSPSFPTIIYTVGGLVVTVGGFVVTSMSSALVMGVAARNAPGERIRRQFALLFLFLLLAALLLGLYLQWPTVPYRYELGLSVFAAHELSKIVFLGPAVGFAFAISPLAVLVHRSLRK